MANRKLFFAAAVYVATAIGCAGGTTGGGTGGTTGGGTTGGANTITITGLAFGPTGGNITVAAGSTITVVNNSTFTHSATSQAAAGDFTNAAATGGWSFDTGLIQPNASATITVPSTVASGATQPYYCSHHTSGMTTPNPVITIQ